MLEQNLDNLRYVRARTAARQCTAADSRMVLVGWCIFQCESGGDIDNCDGVGGANFNFNQEDFKGDLNADATDEEFEDAMSPHEILSRITKKRAVKKTIDTTEAATQILK